MSKLTGSYLNSNPSEKLFVIPKPSRAAVLRLFCFPFAGGSTHIYTPWVEHFGPEVEVVLVQLPGRGARMGEAPYDTMEDCVAEIMLYANYMTSKPFVFFGHSLGSRIAYALSYQLLKHGYPVPRQFFASASRAPHLPNTKRCLFELPKNEFLQALKELNGTPNEVLENAELMELLSPLIRADFKIAELYKAQPIPLSCPFTVLSGTQDKGVTPEQVKAWEELSEKIVQFIEIKGDHFFISKHGMEVLSHVQKAINQQLTRLTYETVV